MPAARSPIHAQVTEVPQSLADALAGQYRLDRLLGEGGMAAVYLAHDLKHDRPVALKVLRPELANALGPERFEREIQLAARLQHPHIVTVLDSGNAAGHLWFTMPFVDGESLRGRLDREKQLPVDVAIRITREAADALDYAHRHGVVHRDIKPENILLTSEHALVADFGIAKALTPDAARLTQSGLAIGTAAYMSPEQASGERELDGRSDIYSLAIVLYEMLAGETPFAAATPQAEIARRFTDTPRALRASRDSVPEHVSAAVQQALSRTTADRFPTARAFIEALSPDVSRPEAVPPRGQPRTRQARTRIPRSFVLFAGGLVIGLGLLFGWTRFAADTPVTPVVTAAEGVVRIAVLPFDNLGDAADAYFADGVTDAVRGKLAGIPHVEVIARLSSSQYSGTTLSPEQIARELGVRYLLTGAVRWARQPDGSSRVQVSPELVETANDGAQVRWSEPFDAPLTDVFQVQGDIAARVARALRLALPASEEVKLAQAPTSNPVAYDAFLRGEAAWSAGANTSPVALREALGYFRQAVALDSNFTAAWVAIAISSVQLYANSTPLPALAQQARAASERALALDPNDAAVHHARGMYYFGIERIPSRALEEYEAAHRLRPGEPRVLRALSSFASAAGKTEEALTHARAAYALDPLSSHTVATLATTYLWLRRLPEARVPADRALALDASNVGIIQMRVMIELAAGDLAAARRILAASVPAANRSELVSYMSLYWDLGWALDDEGRRLALELGPDAYDGDPGSWGIVRAQLYHWSGDTTRSRIWADTAARAFAEQIRAAPEDPQLPVLRALALAYLGRSEEALAGLQRNQTLAAAAPDANTGAYYIHQAVRVHLLLGDHDRALDELETLMSLPYYVTSAWLRIDPDFAPLRGNPRFERLVAGSGSPGPVAGGS